MKKGFGQTVIKDMFTRSLGAGVTINLSGAGFRWIAEVPLTSLAVKQA
jgi:hypothetical protein